jgi:hypothetical protein
MKDQKSSRSSWPIILYIGVAFLLLLLIGNIILILFAINLNKSICSQAAQAAAVVCAGGGNQREIEAAVFRAINEPVINGFFINRPELSELKFYIKSEKGHQQQMLLVKTVTGVHVPAPFLLFIASPEPSGFLRFSSSYVIKLKDFST